MGHSPADKSNKTMNKPKTYTPEYIADREKIDILAKSMQSQILQLNKRLEFIQISDFKLKLNEPTEIAKKHKKWFQFWK